MWHIQSIPQACGGGGGMGAVHVGACTRRLGAGLGKVVAHRETAARQSSRVCQGLCVHTGQARTVSTRALPSQ